MDKEGLLLRRVVKGRSLSPKDYSTVQAIFKPCKTKRSNVMTCIPWPSLLDAVRWQFKSRVEPSRASKPWSSRVSFRFSQGNKDSKIFPLRYIRKTSYLEQGEEKKSRREETQRRIKAEIIKRLGDWFFKYQFNSSCFVFSLLFMHFILAMSG